MDDNHKKVIDGVQDELAELLNRHGIDSWLNIPDFQLARMLLKQLVLYRKIQLHMEGGCQDTVQMIL